MSEKTPKGAGGELIVPVKQTVTDFSVGLAQ
jgi:hypothetical protein